MDIVTSLLAGLVTVVVVMGVGLAISRRSQRLTVVDTLWGLGFVAVAVVSALIGSGAVGQRLLLLLLTAVWGGRLALHLHRRNHGQAEDPRYAELAQADGRSFEQVALRRVFVPQGLSMWLVAAPIMVGAANDRVVVPLAVLGTLVWLVGFVFESVGDAQLARFKADPANRGQVMDSGLWRYTRHPNYFGDATVWFGIWLVAAGSWPGAVTVFSPVVMTVFLTRVTGASLAERRMRSAKPGYEDYVRRTSGFIPLPPRRSA